MSSYNAFSLFLRMLSATHSFLSSSVSSHLLIPDAVHAPVQSTRQAQAPEVVRAFV